MPGVCTELWQEYRIVPSLPDAACTLRPETAGGGSPTLTLYADDQGQVRFHAFPRQGLKGLKKGLTGLLQKKPRKRIIFWVGQA